MTERREPLVARGVCGGYADQGSNRSERTAQILAHVSKVLEGLTDAQFARLSGNGHELWLESELDRAVSKVAGKETMAKSSIRA